MNAAAVGEKGDTKVKRWSRRTEGGSTDKREAFKPLQMDQRRIRKVKN